MKCPRCNWSNPEDGLICNECGSDLPVTDIQEVPDARKIVWEVHTSKAAVASFVLGLLSFGVPVLGIPALLFGIAGIIKIIGNAGQLKGVGFAVIGIIISVIPAGICVLWFFDAEPIENDYTIEDLRSAKQEAADSYILLLSLGEGENEIKSAPAVGLSEVDIEVISRVWDVVATGDYPAIAGIVKENAEEINQAWKHGWKGREIIKRLSRFDEIADLTKPEIAVEIDFIPLRDLAKLYNVYAYLQGVHGNNQAAADELVKLNSVFRKLSVNSRSIIIKLVCYVGLSLNMETANFILNDPQTSGETIALLAENFSPLTSDEVNLRNSMIFEYLTFKNSWDKTSERFKAEKTPLLKLNSSLRLSRKYCDSWIEQQAESDNYADSRFFVWPKCLPDRLDISISSQGQVPWYYKFYNPIGWARLNDILIPAIRTVGQRKMKVEVQDDLFRIVLNKRLGREVSLKARAYGDKYKIDLERKIIYSPGPDGVDFTNDDIKLSIRPEVLGIN
jgi:hypothetical protein